MANSFAVRTARKLIRKGDPMPLDLVFKLTEEGVDPRVLEASVLGEECDTSLDE
ncbi:MAG: hypothetical protein ACRCZI_05435 [Cetobacterium sp.]